MHRGEADGQPEVEPSVSGSGRLVRYDRQRLPTETAGVRAGWPREADRFRPGGYLGPLVLLEENPFVRFHRAVRRRVGYVARREPPLA